MARKKITKKNFRKAVRGTRGIKTKIAKRLSVSRRAVYDFLERYPEMEKVIKREKDKIIDNAEDNVFKAVRNGDLKTSKWILRTIGKQRGYVKKQEIDNTINTDQEDLSELYKEVKKEKQQKFDDEDDDDED